MRILNRRRSRAINRSPAHDTGCHFQPLIIVVYAQIAADSPTGQNPELPQKTIG
jgi:hypothetical protein